MEIDEKPNFDNLTGSEIDELLKKLIEKKKKEKKEEPEIKEKNITVKEVAAILGVSVNTVYILARKGKLKCFKAGSVYFKRSDLDTYFHSTRSESRYENEALCEKNCMISSNGDSMIFKRSFIYQTSLKAVFYLDILSKRKNLPFIRQSKLFI